MSGAARCVLHVLHKDRGGGGGLWVRHNRIKITAVYGRDVAFTMSKTWLYASASRWRMTFCIVSNCDLQAWHQGNAESMTATAYHQPTTQMNNQAKTTTDQPVN